MTDRERLIELTTTAHKERLQKEYDHETNKNVAEYLADHLLANGVIILPCNVGDKVYKIWNCGKHGKSVAEFEVGHIDIDYLPEIEIAFTKTTAITGYYYFAKLNDIGKTVFLTKEEAERALKEREQ